MDDSNQVNALLGPPRIIVVIFVALALWLLWFGLGGHPLNQRSEGRYASAAREMVTSGHWLVPYLRGKPHLTKPPLTYWAEAVGIKLLGPTEWAVRAPSALAGSLTVLGLLALAWRLHGWRFAVLAAGLLAVMPMHVAVSRLTLTDSLLGFFWFATVACALLAVREPQRRLWPVLLWVAVAFGWLTKGHVILLPLLAVVLWLGLGRHWNRLRTLRARIGLPLSVVPLIVWVGLILLRDPDALHVWYREVVNGTVGNGDHPEPFYFFIPIFLAGLFPATLLMDLSSLRAPSRQIARRLMEVRRTTPELPVGRRCAVIARSVGRSIKARWRQLRRSEQRHSSETWLWVLATLVPFIVFSIITRKLVTYLLPLAPPMAMLGAMALERLLIAPGSSRRWSPPFARALGIIVAGGIIGALVVLPWRLGVAHLWLIGPLPLLLAACAWLWATWERRAANRGLALCAAWTALAVCWLWGWHVENRLTTPIGNPRLLAAVREKTGLAQPEVLVCGPRDDSLAFYLNRPILCSREPADIQAQLDEHGRDLVVIAKEDIWLRLCRDQPALTARFDPVLRWEPKPLGDARLVLRGSSAETVLTQ